MHVQGIVVAKLAFWICILWPNDWVYDNGDTHPNPVNHLFHVPSLCWRNLLYMVTLTALGGAGAQRCLGEWLQWWLMTIALLIFGVFAEKRSSWFSTLEIGAQMQLLVHGAPL